MTEKVNAFRRSANLAICALALVSFTLPAGAQDRPLIDSHIHYSHDAWDRLPPPEALKILREAGLQKAFVSSSSDEGTQKLYRLAPDFIVPVLRPYRKRGELSSWIYDESVVGMLESKLAANSYAGIGEFHVFGVDADFPVVRKTVELAHRYGIFLHVHGDTNAIHRLFAQNPEARILWAHSGFTGPLEIRQMLEKYDNLRADLAFRSEFTQSGKVTGAWRQLFLDYPDRFLIGTDTYTPERWYAVADNAAFSRKWLGDLPEPVATRIAHDNAAALVRVAVAGTATGQDAASDCRAETGGDTLRLLGKHHVLLLSVPPQDVVIGQVFAVDLVVCRADGRPYDGDIAIDAEMPAHGHGMNTAASVSKLGPGRFRAEGMMFHMPGVWRYRLHLSGGKASEELEAEMMVQ